VTEEVDYVKIEVRAGDRVRTVELHAQPGRKLRLDLDVTQHTVDAAYDGFVHVVPIGTDVRLLASGPSA
jgi:hypothetical protein